jgi:hypothetical protein
VFGVRGRSVRDVLAVQPDPAVAIFTPILKRVFLGNHVGNRAFNPAKHVTVGNSESFLYFDGIDFVCHKKAPTA